MQSPLGLRRTEVLSNREGWPLKLVVFTQNRPKIDLKLLFVRRFWGFCTSKDDVFCQIGRFVHRVEKRLMLLAPRFNIDKDWSLMVSDTDTATTTQHAEVSVFDAQN